MADKDLNIVIKAKDAATATFKKVGAGLGTLSNVAGKVGSGLKTAGLVAGGVATAVAGFTIAAVAAAADEQKQIASVNAQLKQRGMLTEANTAALDGQISALENLGYADDAVRASIATATSFTKNFADAVKIQNAAADIAAAKNISLEEATALVGRAYQGNTKGLKGLGIETKKGAKGLSVLTSITKKYGGTAAAAADSVQGRFNVAQIKMANTFEDFGAAFLPIASDVLGFFNSDIAPAIGKGLDALQPFVAGAVDGFKNKVAPAIGDFVGKLTEPGGVIDSVGKVAGPVIDGLGKAFGDLVQNHIAPFIGKIMEIIGLLWGDGQGPLALAVQGIGKAFEIAFAVIGVVLDVIGTALGVFANVFIGAFGVAKTILEALFAPIKAIIDAFVWFNENILGNKPKAPPMPPTSTASVGTSFNGQQLYSAPAVAPKVEVNVSVPIDGGKVADAVDKRLGVSYDTNGGRTR
jgi:hypothetical protein